jgi:hypothetical protein
MRYVIDCFRLHKILKSLSEAHEKSFPESTVAKLVSMAEELGCELGAGLETVSQGVRRGGLS